MNILADPSFKPDLLVAKLILNLPESGLGAFLYHLELLQYSKCMACDHNLVKYILYCDSDLSFYGKTDGCSLIHN